MFFIPLECGKEIIADSFSSTIPHELQTEHIAHPSHLREHVFDMTTSKRDDMYG